MATRLSEDSVPRVAVIGAGVAGTACAYAQTITPLGAPDLGVADGSLFLGGDWCLGARAGYAFQNGRAKAAAQFETWRA